MALAGTELVEVQLADAMGHPAAVSTLLPLSQLTSLPVGSTVEVIPAITNGNQVPTPRRVKTSLLGGVGANDQVEVQTPIGPAIAGTSGKKQSQKASDVNAYVS